LGHRLEVALCHRPVSLHAPCSRLPVALYVRNDDRPAKLVKLIAQAGPLDIDDPAPAITVMLPDED